MFILFIERAHTHTRTHTRARNSGETNRRNDFEHWKRHSRRISNRHEIHATLTGKVTTRTVHVSRTTPVDWASRRAQAPDLSRARDVFLCCGVPFSLSLSLSLSLFRSLLFFPLLLTTTLRLFTSVSLRALLWVSFKISESFLNHGHFSWHVVIIIRYLLLGDIVIIIGYWIRGNYKAFKNMEYLWKYENISLRFF